MAETLMGKQAGGNVSGSKNICGMAWKCCIAGERVRVAE